MVEDSKYCGTCGERYGDDIPKKEKHDCPYKDEDDQWCHHCGAELKDTGSCDNDHTEED